MPRPANCFLLLAGFAALAFAFFLPPFQAPDEGYHFFRSYQLSEGKFREEMQEGRIGALVPQSLVDFFNAFQDLPLHPQRRVSVDKILDFRHQPLAENRQTFFFFALELPHPALPYFPQALALSVGKFFQLPPFYLLYLARLLNASVWILLVYGSLRITPLQSWLWALLALTPMSLQQAASLSPDAFTNGASYLLLAMVLKIALSSEDRVKPALLAGTVALSLAFAVSKLGYAAHALLFFLIPRRKFSSRASHLFYVGGAILLNILAVLFFLHSSGMSDWPEVAAQRQALAANPIAFLGFFLHTFAAVGLRYLWQFIGWLGHLDTPLPPALAIAYWLALFGVAWIDRKTGLILQGRQKALLVAVACLEVGTIWLGLYLTWDQSGANWIHGGQGRYLIPLAPLLFLALYRPLTEASQSWSSKAGWLVCGTAFMGFATSLAKLARRFYGAF